jgi:hypothetical protein
MLTLYNPGEPKGGFIEFLLAKMSEGSTLNTDIRAIALSNLITLQNKIKRSIPITNDRMTKAHLQYVLRELEESTGENEYPEKGFPLRMEGIKAFDDN